MTTVMVALGASGDMARRLLLPSLYGLEAADKLGDLRIIGYALDDWTEDHFKDEVKAGITDLAQIKLDDGVWQRFSARISYLSGNLDQGNLAQLAKVVEGNALFYLALPPGVFAAAAGALASVGLNRSDQGWRRLIIEKPFGTDIDSAEALNEALHQSWSEEQIFRIDHFLGKETVQNILVFRFGNRFLDPVLNASHVQSVQITAAETLGLAGRYRYYDGIGALRDMLQSHLMQLLALVAMEPPSLWDSDIIHDHKTEVLRSIRPLSPADIGRHAARGQYTAGEVDGQKVPGYLEEEGIPADSHTETFAALKLNIDNWRWGGVPFYLRSGKRLAGALTEVVIQFKEPPTRLFHETQIAMALNNRLVFRLKPVESINLFVQAREPGLELSSRQLELHAEYARQVDPDSASYQQLLLDAVAGDQTSFLRFDEVEWAWRILTPVLEAWKQGAPQPYAAGSEGPDTQDAIMEPGDAWRRLIADRVDH